MRPAMADLAAGLAALAARYAGPGLGEVSEGFARPLEALG
jgi:hypothetical protein